jgi:hypothetical protein
MSMTLLKERENPAISCHYYAIDIKNNRLFCFLFLDRLKGGI